jgi:hypothetical protein
MPRLTDSEFWKMGSRDTYIIARAVHDEEIRSGIRPAMLVELRLGPENIWDFSPLKLAMLDRFLEDRQEAYALNTQTLITNDNPSVLSSSPEEIERFLKQRNIGWIVIWSLDGAKALTGLAEPVGSVGSRTLLSFGLESNSVLHCRIRLQELAESLPKG